MNDPLMDQLFQDDPVTMERCYPAEYRLRSDPQFRAHMATFDQAAAAAEAAKLSAAEKEKKDRFDQWQQESEGRGLTPAQASQVAEIAMKHTKAALKSLAGELKEVFASRDAFNDQVEEAFQKHKARIDSLLERVDQLQSHLTDMERKFAASQINSRRMI